MDCNIVHEEDLQQYVAAQLLCIAVTILGMFSPVVLALSSLYCAYLIKDWVVSGATAAAWHCFDSEERVQLAMQG
jgi:hypothetical protein